MKHKLIIALLQAIPSLVMAQNPEVFQPEGKAIRGFDPVSFFSDSAALPGKAKYQLRWKNADWFFASAAHRDSFQLAPERYAPQYGGWCAYGTAGGYKAPTEIDTWTIHQGKLYFNYNRKVKARWMEQKETLIPKADKNWEAIREKG